MWSAFCFNLDHSKILLSGNGLKTSTVNQSILSFYFVELNQTVDSRGGMC